jgi:hypothetical protein
MFNSPGACLVSPASSGVATLMDRLNVMNRWFQVTSKVTLLDPNDKSGIKPARRGKKKQIIVGFVRFGGLGCRNFLHSGAEE